MSKYFKLSMFTVIVAIAFAFAFSPSSVVQADAHEFDLYVKHNINGRSLGFEKELPVDVYVNGGYAFSFNFGESFSASLPAGEYYIEVKLAGTETVVMSLGPTEIPAGVDVSIRATLGTMKSPTLRVNVK
jgi:hypothetical protein